MPEPLRDQVFACGLRMTAILLFMLATFPLKIQKAAPDHPPCPSKCFRISAVSAESMKSGTGR